MICFVKNYRKTHETKIIKQSFGLYQQHLDRIKHLAEIKSRSVSGMMRILIDEAYMKGTGELKW